MFAGLTGPGPSCDPFGIEQTALITRRLTETVLTGAITTIARYELSGLCQTNGLISIIFDTYMSTLPSN